MTGAGLLGDVLAALHASGARPKLTPFVRANLAEIEKVLANGFTYAQLADALNKQGFRATENGFRSALHQARKTARPPEKATSHGKTTPAAAAAIPAASTAPTVLAPAPKTGGAAEFSLGSLHRRASWTTGE